MSTLNTASVKKHRAKMAEEGNARFELTLRRTFIKQMREISREKRLPFWLFVERALIAYVISGNDK
jgi:hypothetical protein